MYTFFLHELPFKKITYTTETNSYNPTSDNLLSYYIDIYSHISICIILIALYKFCEEFVS
jgi:hypothetical protein